MSALTNVPSLLPINLPDAKGSVPLPGGVASPSQGSPLSCILFFVTMVYSWLVEIIIIRSTNFCVLNAQCPSPEQPYLETRCAVAGYIGVIFNALTRVPKFLGWTII